MSQLMPVTPELAAELEERFASSKFRSTDFFIDFYNSGLVNKAADEVVEFATAVDATFKNVKLQGKTLVFISEAEVYLAEVLEELKLWDILVKVKARVRSLAEAGELSEDTVVEFPGGSGVLVATEQDEDGQERQRKLTDEKFFKPADEELMRAFHAKHSSAEGEWRFHALDFLSLDDSFIEPVWERVVSR